MTGNDISGIAPTLAMSDPRAYSVAAFRACRHDAGIGYRATLEATGPHAVKARVAAMIRDGLVDATHHKGDYAVLDIIDVEGAPIGDLAIRTEAAFERIRPMLNLHVTCSDCDQCDPYRRSRRRRDTVREKW